MEKRSAHYDLGQLKLALLQVGIDGFTATARNNARLMGLDTAQALVVVQSLQRGMLFKSMTTHADSKVWQDVYLAPCPNGKTAYIKLTLREGAVVIQFKEK